MNFAAYIQFYLKLIIHIFFYILTNFLHLKRLQNPLLAFKYPVLQIIYAEYLSMLQNAPKMLVHGKIKILMG